MYFLTMRLSPLVSERALPISLITTSISLGTGRSEFILGVASHMHTLRNRESWKSGQLHACLSICCGLAFQIRPSDLSLTHRSDY